MLGVFARIPDREPVKTRLQARLSAAQAGAFQLAALVDTLETAAQVVDAPWLFLSHGDDARDRIGTLLSAHGLGAESWRRVQLCAQQGPDLGARMTRALDALRAHSRHALLVGADSPGMTCVILQRALESLDNSDVVLGPARDGGCWCIGAPAGVATADLFDGVRWGESDVFAMLCARARALGRRLHVADPCSDVDRPADLDLLAAQITALRRAGDRATARHSERWLRSEGWLSQDAAS